MRHLSPFLALALLGCADFNTATKPSVAPEAPANAVQAPAPSAGARTVEQFDTTTDAQRAAAAKPASAGKALGAEVASLGDPSKPGFWIETTLVSEAAMGRITVASGQSVEVELRPIADGSARVSLAAWRLLEVPLTALAEVEVSTS